MKILVTGAKGFVGKNLVLALKNAGYAEVFEYDIDSPDSLLDEACSSCNFVFHLAGVNRPQNAEEFMTGNFGFTDTLLAKLKASKNKAPILITSSIQASLDNPYGQSKKAGEDLMFDYSKTEVVEVMVYRLPNIFGKWCRPNYNSAIATFCNNIANDLPITVNDRSVQMHVVYIDDVLAEFLRALKLAPTRLENGFCEVPVSHKASLGEIVDTIYSFRASRENLQVPNLQKGSLETKLYSTYLSYLPRNAFSYPLKMNVDARGSFTEFLRTPERGQVSVNITKSGITKGNHWHNSKNEKFLVVQGEGIIRFRKIDESEIIEYKVNGEKLEVVDIPTGYTHNIENVGAQDLITVMWANEAFDPSNPDTYFNNV